MVQPVLTLLLAGELLFLNGIFNLVQLRDLLQGFGGLLRMILLGLNEATATMHPALSMSNTFLGRGIAGICGITIADQSATELVVQNLLDVQSAPTVRVGKHHFVVITV